MRYPSVALILLGALTAATPAAAFLEELEKGVQDLERALEGGMNATGESAPAPAPSGDEAMNGGNWAFGDWTVVTWFDEGGQLFECQARTGGTDENELIVQTHRGSEYAYPDVFLRHIELTPRSEPLFGPGERVTFRFDGGAEQYGEILFTAAEHTAFGEHDHYDAQPFNPERTLSWMADHDTVTLVRDFDGMGVDTLSLSGFKAAYLKLVEQCGTTRDGIL